MNLLRLSANVSLAAMGLALSACGGGGVNSTPTSPTPGTPAPSPPPSYSTFSEMMAAPGDKTLQMVGLSTSWTGNATVVPLGNQLKLEYVAASNTYRLTRPGGTSVSFDAASGSGSMETSMRFATPDGDTLLLLAPTSDGVRLTYTRLAYFGRSNDSTTNLAVLGVLTKNGDMPKDGVAVYSFDVGGTLKKGSDTYDLGLGANGGLLVNFGDGTLHATIGLIGTRPGDLSTTYLGLIGGDGRIASGTPAFSGNLAGDGPDPLTGAGQFAGAFFGPQAAETGLTWSFEGPEVKGGGYAVGTKQK